MYPINQQFIYNIIDLCLHTIFLGEGGGGVGGGGGGGVGGNFLYMA